MNNPVSDNMDFVHQLNVWKEDYDVKVGMHRIIMLSKEIHKNIKHNQDGNKVIVMRILFTNTSCHPRR